MEMTTITTSEELARLLQASSEHPVLLFKHSNACPVSARAHGEVESFLSASEGGGFDFGMVVVQKARPVSNEIESTLGIEHESPQAIVVRDGKAVWNASHFAVTVSALEDALAAK